MSSWNYFFFERSSFKLRCLQSVIGIVPCCCHQHVAFFTIWAKLTVAFTCTSLPLNLYTSVFGCGCGFGFEQNFWRIWRKKGTHRRICIPLLTPLSKRVIYEFFECSTSGVWNGQDWSVLGQEKKKSFRNRGMFKIGIGFSLSTRPESRRSSPLDLSVLKTIYFSSSQNMSLLLLPEKKICYLLPLDKELPTPRELLSSDHENAEVRTCYRLF